MIPPVGPSSNRTGLSSPYFLISYIPNTFLQMLFYKPVFLNFSSTPNTFSPCETQYIIFSFNTFFTFLALYKLISFVSRISVIVLTERQTNRGDEKTMSEQGQTQIDS